MADSKNPESAAAVASPTVQSGEPSDAQKRVALLIVSFCHMLNHLQYNITSVLFPVMMRDLGFGFLQLGVLSAVANLTGQGLQVTYGFFAGLFKRTAILGLGNVILGVSTIFHALVGSYPQLVVARVVSGIGSSPQHPLGASVLSRYYPKARGWALTFHYTAGNVGSFLAPALVAFILLYMGWREAFVIFGLPTLLMGLSLFLLRDWSTAQDEAQGRKKSIRANTDAYIKCLKNRNILFTSLVLMVGAAGRGTGINVTYLVPFFMDRLEVTAPVGGLLLTVLQGAGLVGPLVIGWLSDRLGRRTAITQVTLLLSALMTVWLVHHSALTPLFFLNLILYGSFVQARGSLTQAMIGDFASEELTDAAFSIYYFVGFISGPMWTLIIGYLMDQYGFAPAFYVAAATYLAGMVLLAWIRE